MKIGFYFFIITLFFGCSEASESNPETITSPINSIVFLNDYCSTWLQKVRINYADKDQIYKKEIEKPVIKNYFSQCEYSDLIKENFSYPVKDTLGVSKALESIRNNEKEIAVIIRNAIMKCYSAIPNDSIAFYILPPISNDKEFFKKMGGVSGITAGSKKIILSIDPSVPMWKETLQYAVAHEYTHAYWTKHNYSNSFKWTLLNYLVFEGVADNFAHSLYPKVKASWTTALTEKEKKELWNKIKSDLMRESMENKEVMFGSGNYPTWGGYTLGYSIVQSALKKNPQLKLTEWINMDAKKLLELSDFK